MKTLRFFCSSSYFEVYNNKVISVHHFTSALVSTACRNVAVTQLNLVTFFVFLLILFNFFILCKLSRKCIRAQEKPPFFFLLSNLFYFIVKRIIIFVGLNLHAPITHAPNSIIFFFSCFQQ